MSSYVCVCVCVYIYMYEATNSFTELYLPCSATISNEPS
jgi:hypothetical protein